VKTGLMWFDDSASRELQEKILRATAHYKEKYGQPPDLCFVNPNVLDGNGNSKGALEESCGVEIRSARSVLMHHFWLGVAEDETQPSGARS